MLEIFILIWLCRSIDPIAGDKGEKPGKWKLYIVLSWFATEILVAFLISMMGAGIIISILAAYVAAYLSFVLIKKKLMSLPDKSQWLDEIGNEAPPASQPE